MVAGVIPVITHPERLTWIEGHYDVFKRLVKGGAWMQLTAGSTAVFPPGWSGTWLVHETLRKVYVIFS